MGQGAATATGQGAATTTATGRGDGDGAGRGDGKHAEMGQGAVMATRRTSSLAASVMGNGAVGENFLSMDLYSRAFSPSSRQQPGLKVGISPGWCHQPRPKASFQQPKGRGAEAFGPG